VSVAPRIVQAPAAALVVNAPGRPDRANGRSLALFRTAPAAPRKLAHVVLTSPDAAATTRFCVDGLGFRVSDRVGDDAAFMRCSSDHHNLLVQAAPVAFVHHTAWEMADVDEVGRAASAMLAGDPARHVWGLGRHYLGSNYFWYLRDPAGNYAEYTSDVDVILDDARWVAESLAAGPKALAAWGPPVPAAFLFPEDVPALMAAEEAARAGSTRAGSVR
jgi:catechol 2,3-dioxygenase-like lactoylglutathione lyase family enzyme